MNNLPVVMESVILEKNQDDLVEEIAAQDLIELDRVRKNHLAKLIQEFQDQQEQMKNQVDPVTAVDVDAEKDDMIPIKKLEDELLSVLEPEHKIEFLKKKYFESDLELQEIGARHLKHLEQETEKDKKMTMKMLGLRDRTKLALHLEKSESMTELYSLANFPSLSSFSEVYSAVSCDSCSSPQPKQRRLELPRLGLDDVVEQI